MDIARTDSSGVILGAFVLCIGLEGCKTRTSQYGHFGNVEYCRVFSVQLVQYDLSVFWLSLGLVPHVYYEAVAMIIAFVLSGKLLEARAKQSTSASIRSLMGLQPKTARLVGKDGEEKMYLLLCFAPGIQ